MKNWGTEKSDSWICALTYSLVAQPGTGQGCARSSDLDNLIVLRKTTFYDRPSHPHIILPPFLHTSPSSRSRGLLARGTSSGITEWFQEPLRRCGCRSGFHLHSTRTLICILCFCRTLGRPACIASTGIHSTKALPVGPLHIWSVLGRYFRM